MGVQMKHMDNTLTLYMIMYGLFPTLILYGARM
jgi:hypothetical protein